MKAPVVPIAIARGRWIPRVDDATPRGAAPGGRQGSERRESPEAARVVPMYRLYTPEQVGWATLFGGVVGGALLLALNFLRLRRAGSAALAVVAGVLGTLAAIALTIAAPLHLLLILYAATTGMVLVTEIVQGDDFVDHRHYGGLREVGRSVPLPAAVGLVATSSLVIGALWALT